MRTARILAAVAIALVSVTCQAEPWALWQAYCQSFIDGQGRVVDHQGGDRTTSEGQAYALFFALVANDRPKFDALLAWTRDNLAQGDLTTHRPGWQWGKAQDGSWKLLDANSASDADLWMCYTLAEAGRLWNEPSYTALSRIMAARIAQQEVTDLPGFGPMLLPGTDGFHPSAQVWVLNPSYVPLPVLERLARTDATGPWAAIAEKLPQFLGQSAPHGFAMDWVSYSPESGFQPVAAPGNAKAVPEGSYDAIRVYLWAGITSSADQQYHAVLGAVGGMGEWLKTHMFPPAQVASSGVPNGLDAPVGFSAAVVPYLSGLGENAALAKQRDRMAAQLDSGTKLYGHPPAYYDQNLAMFSEGWLSHRFRFGSDGELKVTWKK